MPNYRIEPIVISEPIEISINNGQQLDVEVKTIVLKNLVIESVTAHLIKDQGDIVDSNTSAG